MADEKAHAAELDKAARYAAWATLSEAGKARHRRGVLFKTPRKVDPLHLVPARPAPGNPAGALELDAHHRRRREGFALTDKGMDLTGALDHANYCIFCHNQGKDSCSKGLKEKDGGFKKIRLRRDARRLPARGKDLRDAHAEGGRRLARRARHGRSSTIRCWPRPATASATTA